MNTQYFTYSPFIQFIDLETLNKEIRAIPSRNKKCRELTARVKDIGSRIRNAYVEASRKCIEGSSPSYFIPAKEIFTDDGLLTVNLEEFAPMLPSVQAKVEIEGTVYNLNFRDPGYARKTSGMKMTCPELERALDTLLTDYTDLMSDGVKIQYERIEVPIFEGDLFGEEAKAVEAIVKRHLDDAERRVDEWLGDLDEYADPFSLFGAMI